MFQKLVIKWVIAFILKQIEKAQGKLDWAAIAAETDQKLRDFLPSFLEDSAIELANLVLGIAEKALDDEDSLKKIMLLIANKDLVGAALALRDLILAAWSASAPEEQDAHAFSLVAQLV